MKYLTIGAPALGARYWACLCVASVLGADLGDVCSHLLGLGYWRGLPAFAALFALVIVAAHRFNRTDVWYWIAILLVRAAATNISDLQTEGFGERFLVVIVIEAMILAPLVAIDRRDYAAQRSMVAGALFWLTMLVAGTLGTTIGDDLAFGQELRPPSASALMTLVLAGTFATRITTGARSALAYWGAVLVIRTWGTNVGDFFAEGAGLLDSTAASAIVLLGLVLLWRTPARPAAASGD